MGSAIGLRVLQAESRITRAVLGGVGDLSVRVDPRMLEVAARQLEEENVEVLSPLARVIRRRVDQVAGDRRALAAMWRGPFAEFEPSFQHVAANVLLITGEADSDFGDPYLLGRCFRNASVMRPPTDHDSTMEHPAFVRALVHHLCS